MQDIQSYTERILQLIASNKITEAIKELQQLLKGSPLYDEFILQSARYSDVMKSIRMGTIGFEKSNIEKNNVRYALLDMIRELEVGSDEKADLRQEVGTYLQEQAVATHNELHVTGDKNISVQGSSGNQITITSN